MIAAVQATVNEGKIGVSLDVFNGREVIVVGLDTWNMIAGSDSVRFQLKQAQGEIALLKGELQRRGSIDRAKE